VPVAGALDCFWLCNVSLDVDIASIPIDALDIRMQDSNLWQKTSIFSGQTTASSQ